MEQLRLGLIGRLLSLAAFVLIVALPVGLTLTTIDDHKEQEAVPAKPAAAHV